jgi:hypothetical protein
MNSKRAWLATLLAFVLVAVAGCDIGGVDPIPQTLEWHGIVEGEAEWEHLEGEAAFAWTEGTQEITAGVLVTGDEPGEVRPWHVHHNTCAEGGGIVGSDDDYPRLVIEGDGTASVVTNVPVGIDPAADFHVNVHLSEEEMETIIACADLTLIPGF